MNEGFTRHKRYQVGILGVTGAVGQRFLAMLADHPWFEVRNLMASERSVGKPLRSACHWYLDTPIPAGFADWMIEPANPEWPLDLVFSGLDASVAGPIEELFARSGIPVVTNTRNHRMDPDVPLIVPEINPDHLDLIPQQRCRFGSNGFIVTNPNCSTIILSLALAPLHRIFRVRRLMVSTLQGLSGAGYPGISALDILDNVIPYISGEEQKIALEPRKIFGDMRESTIDYADMTISARCHRVAVRDGHMITASVDLDQPWDFDAIQNAWRTFNSPIDAFGLPSAPRPCIVVADEANRPQSRKDRDAGNGMSVTVGRLSACPILGLSFTVVGHNTIRGAAGGSILLAELLAARGYLDS
mgnify:CR=1 FL=1